MLARLLVLMVLITCLDACKGLSVTSQPPMDESSVQIKNFKFFDRIEVDAPINVRIHPGAAYQRAVLHGDPRDLNHIKMRVKAGLFMLVLDEKQTPMNTHYPRYGAVQLDLYTKNLRALTYKGDGLVVAHGIQAHTFDLTIENPEKTILDGYIGLRCLTVNGSGTVQINGVKSQDLKIKMTGNPKVQLTGVANLTRLTTRGGAALSFYWLKSSTLIVRQYDSSRVKLAGIVDRLDVELWDKARFNGRYIRASHNFVKTHEHTVAEIASVTDQHTLSTDASDIYFYNLPTMRADFMAINGATLDMRDWHLEIAQPYTDYNK